MGQKTLAIIIFFVCDLIKPFICIVSKLTFISLHNTADLIYPPTFHQVFRRPDPKQSKITFAY